MEGFFLSIAGLALGFEKGNQAHLQCLLCHRGCPEGRPTWKTSDCRGGGTCIGCHRKQSWGGRLIIRHGSGIDGGIGNCGFTLLENFLNNETAFDTLKNASGWYPSSLFEDGGSLQLLAASRYTALGGRILEGLTSIDIILLSVRSCI